MKRAGMALVFTAAMLCAAGEAQAQFTSVWLDIGDFQNAYVGSGARGEDGVTSAPAGWRYPGYIRSGENINSHSRGEAFWVGVKDWTDQNGQDWPYYVARTGPRRSGADVSFPLENRLLSKWQDSEVSVDGLVSFERSVVVDEVDPDLPADRVAETTWNIGVGITAKRRAYAYSNDYQDNYQIVEFFFTNTGNADEDSELELEGQTLNDVYFFWINRVRGIRQAADQGDDGQIWGKYNMVDVVGDGHAEYPVDFTAIYNWHGDEPSFNGGYSLLGSPLWSFGRGSIADDDTLGRLSGGHMAGEMILYAPNSTDDPTYDPLVQPRTLSVMDQDEALTSDGAAERDYYELGILARPENRDQNDPTNSRMWPHYADRIEPSGEFWNQTGDPASGKQGGFAPLTAYGPYDIGPGETIHIVTAQAVNGLTYDAQFDIGRAYKLARGNDQLVIEYDANGDGTIECKAPLTAAIYASTYDYGSECLTKNQWVMTARDSLFKSFYQARDIWEASNGMTQYPSQAMQPPLPPLTFTVFGRPDQIELTWEPMSGGPPMQGWEIYRTSRYADNLPYVCVRGAAPDCLGPMLPASETSFNDTEATGVVRGTDYYYHLLAVGENQPHDPNALNGTPGGVPLRSSRYFTQTWQPTNLKRPSGTLEAARVVPNPINFTSSGGDNGIRFGREDEIAFFNIPGECTIKIYSEVGELIHTIEHTNGSGDEKWNLTTASRQLLTSGIYIAVFETKEGERAFQKFTVIR